MPFHLGVQFPNFSAEVSGYDGKEFEFHNYIGDDWCILFSHPSDFTPVCTTELAKASQLIPEFNKRSCKLVALSCSSTDEHIAWEKDIIAYKGGHEKLGFPIISDKDRSLAVKLGIMDPMEKDKMGLPMTCRCAFFIDPTKTLRASILYPATTGRDLLEFLRVLDSLQLSDKYPIATPEGWNTDKKCMVIPSLTDEKAKETFPNGFEKVDVPSGKNYIRMTKLGTAKSA